MSTTLRLCALQGAAGRVERCPGDACPFWEEGGAVVMAGCAIERLAVNLSGSQLVRDLLELRLTLDRARRLGARDAPSLFDVLGLTRDL